MNLKKRFEDWVNSFTGLALVSVMILCFYLAVGMAVGLIYLSWRHWWAI